MIMHLTHFIRHSPKVISDIFVNIFINMGNIEKYLIESCSEDPNNKSFLNFFHQSARFDEQIQEN